MEPPHPDILIPYNPIPETVAVTRHSYGSEPEQFGDLYMPSSQEPVPVVVLIHGGWWRSVFDLGLERAIAADILQRGIGAVWNIEYRRVGNGGGWSTTFEDVAAAIDALESFGGLDLDRVVAVGHSAGGHLAAWSLGRHTLPAGLPGSEPVVELRTAVAQSAVLDLVGCANDGLGDGACLDLMGAMPASDPDRFASSSPLEMLPIGRSLVVVHGDADDIVPLDQSLRYADAAREQGDHTDLIVLGGAGHFVHIDPRTTGWTIVADRLEDLMNTLAPGDPS